MVEAETQHNVMQTKVQHEGSPDGQRSGREKLPLKQLQVEVELRLRLEIGNFLTVSLQVEHLAEA